MKIETGIPIPPLGSRLWRDVLNKMNVGDSVLIEKEDEMGRFSRINSMRLAAKKMGYTGTRRS